MSIHSKRPGSGIVAALLLATAVLWPGFAAALGSCHTTPRSGNQAVKRGRYRGDVYATGGSVTVDAVVGGDVVAAGGDVSVAGTVRRDDLVAGRNVVLKGKVDDDVRALGISIAVDLHVGGDLLAAGDKIRTSAATRVGGHAWFVGRFMDLSGDFGRDLVATGGRIRLSGHVHGDATLTAGMIDLLPGTVIDGNLVYRSNHALKLGKAVIVRGTLTREPYVSVGSELASIRAQFTILFYISLYLTALILVVVFPRFGSAAAERLRSRPLASLGLGFAVLVATPLVALMALMSGVSYLPGLALLALYPVALLAGLLVGILWLGEVGARVAHRDASRSLVMRLLSLAAALIALILVDFIPVLGGLLWFLLMLVGVGAGGLQLARQYSGRA